VNLWDVPDKDYRESPSPSERHGALIHSVAFSRGGQHFATASDDGTAIIWDATKGRRLRTIRPEDNAISVFSVAFVPGETELLATGSLRGIKLWDPTTGQFSSELPRSPDVPESHQTFSMAFSRDGRLAAAGANDGSVHLYRKSPRGWTISKARD